MSGLAKIFIEMGYKVSGSDLSENHLIKKLQEMGAEVYIGHNAENINDCALVVRSSAIKRDNPELQKANELNIPVMHRSELLNKLMTLHKRSVGVTGTHGKTTTTGMITTIFSKLGLEPSFVIGGELPLLKTNAAYGNGANLICELDESDGTIIKYKPDITVITNLEFEHPDHYEGGFDELVDLFLKYILNLDTMSKIILNLDDEGNSKLIRKFLGLRKPEHENIESMYHMSRFVTYSIGSHEADYYAFLSGSDPCPYIDVFKRGHFLGQIKINVPGRHNVSNIMAAIATAMEAEIDFTWISAVIPSFTGMKKRFQTLGEAKGAQIVDDYAHHPTEIIATLQTAKSLNKNRVIAVFQPHRYTRFASLWGDFLICFRDADVVYVTDVYSAEEEPVENINSEEFHKQLQHPSAYYIKGELENVAEEIIKEIKNGDIIVTMGAGSITKLGRIILEKVNGNYEE